MNAVKGFFINLRKYLIEGFVFLLPLVVTGFVVYIIGQSLYQALDFVIVFLPEGMQEFPYIKLISAAVTFFAIIFLIILIGLIANSIIGKAVSDIIDGVFESIPFVKMLYRGLKQLFEFFIKNQDPTKNFSRVVLIEFPTKGEWSIAFVTGEADKELIPAAKRGDKLKVYMPMVPLITSGIFMVVSKSQVKETNLSVEEAVKYCVSLGMLKGK